MFYKGNPKEIKEYEIGEDIFVAKDDEETSEAVKSLVKNINKAEYDENEFESIEDRL